MLVTVLACRMRVLPVLVEVVTIAVSAMIYMSSANDYARCGTCNNYHGCTHGHEMPSADRHE